MKATMKKLVCILMCLLLVGQALVVLAACNAKIDPETTPLILSTDALDGVFNPFSYTSGADGGVVGQTQLGMLNIDTEIVNGKVVGKVVAGWDQPTVAEAYSVVTVGDEKDYDRDGDYSNYYTDYYFAIKDGIKFSDGTPLTIKDVLFNLYLYLDPVYSGSSTMYSTAIKGLSAYRTQDESDDAQSNLNDRAEGLANERLLKLLGWCNLAGTANADMSLADYCAGDKDMLEVLQNDIAKIKELFKEELNTDWVAAASMVEEYEKYYLQSSTTDAIKTPSAWKDYTKEGNKNKHISEQWEVFALMYGMITTKTEKLGEGADSVRKYTFEYNSSDTYDHSQKEMVNRTFSDFFPANESGEQFKKKLKEVVTIYATANSYFEYAVNKAKEEILTEGEMEFDHIEGITVFEANSIPESDISSGARTFDSNRTILRIRINGIDPKALLSFSFSVAPMNYYSTEKAIKNFKELPDTQEDIYGNGDKVTVKHYTGFGVEYASTDFMNVINTNLVPRGAGPYRASNGTEKGVSDTATLEKSDFFKNNIVNFERNNYFDTVMKGGHNANIKFLRYKVIASNAMTDAVTGKNPEVHVSQPSASQKEIQAIRKLSGVKYITVDYMGYGYIGINASFVHDINVRRAIMHAMDVSLCADYYGSDDLVSIIYRSMSKNNWAYPDGLEDQYYPFDNTVGEDGEPYPIIRDLVRRAGYTVDSSTGILTNDEKEQLKFTFTVAGETEDHPAYQTMAKAAAILNSVGFDITVTKDTQALSKLASGGLQIWAAAWSSSIDPDMYQVYHKDSTASSIKNWGYPYLLRDGTWDEKEILTKLATAIEKGRKYNDEDERKPYYEEALNLVMELAVELPTYQRKEMYLINTEIVDINTLCEANVYQSPLSMIWDVNFVK